ncbi:very short patch repair endonuclease [Mesorhizobium australicum]|uniref:very short patch repair endonuclease n=1 Tax=Mesorhizobium australicum TaxID=536018 RepID=UPI0033352ECB
MDFVDLPTRSRMMAAIKGRNTRPELRVRQALHSLGFRYRLNSDSLPGRPDIVFPKYSAVVFIHGCFWHRHQGCRHSTMPATRVEFWTAKFAQNQRRDIDQRDLLLQSGWRVATVWGCELKAVDISEAIDAIVRWLLSCDIEMQFPPGFADQSLVSMVQLR